MDVPQARRLERPTWLNARTILGLFLFVSSFVAGQRLLATEPTTSPVWVASRDLSPGTELSPEDLQVVEVDLPPSLSGSYAAADLDLTTAVLSQPVLKGQMIPVAWTAASNGLESRLMSVPLSPEHAVGGDLRSGDVVDIYATFKGERGDARTVLLAASVEIVDTVAGSELIGASGEIGGATISVSEEEAPRIAFALRTADLDIVKVVGAEPTDTDRVVTGEDL